MSDVTRGDWQQPADLVVAAYVLGELPPAARARFIERLVTMATVAVVVEPGTPEGFARVLAAREVALAAGGRTVAPCPHDEACPLARPDWCHFAARVNRTKLHRQIKGPRTKMKNSATGRGPASRWTGRGRPAYFGTRASILGASRFRCAQWMGRPWRP